MRYWGNLPPEVVSHQLGFTNDEYWYDISKGYGEFKDIDPEVREEYAQYLIDHCGDAESAVVDFLNEVREEAQWVLDSYLEQHGVDPYRGDVHRYQPWYKNIPDDMTYEELFNLIGGGAEYNELLYRLIPDMLKWVKSDASPESFLAELQRAVRDIDDQQIWTAISDLRKEAEQYVRNLLTDGDNPTY